QAEERMTDDTALATTGDLAAASSPSSQRSSYSSERRHMSDDSDSNKKFLNDAIDSRRRNDRRGAALICEAGRSLVNAAKPAVARIYAVAQTEAAAQDDRLREHFGLDVPRATRVDAIGTDGGKATTETSS